MAADVTGVGRQGGHLATRRWYYLIPATGEPRGLVHTIEKNSSGASARDDGAVRRPRSARSRPAHAARRACAASRWNTRPGCAIPYVARVDAGTIELVRQSGVDVVSSGDLIQRFSTVWDADGDRDAPAGVRQALPREGSRVRGGRAPPARRRRHDRIRHPAADGRLVSRRRARQRRRAERLGRPRTPATRTTCRRRPSHRAIRADEIVLLDLWGKLESSRRGVC